MRARQAASRLLVLLASVVLLGAAFTAVPLVLLTRKVTDGGRYTIAGAPRSSRPLVFTVARDYPDGAVLQCGLVDYLSMREPRLELQRYVVARQIDEQLEQASGIVERAFGVPCEGGIRLDVPLDAGFRVLLQPRLLRASQRKFGIWQFYATLMEPAADPDPGPAD